MYWYGVVIYSVVREAGDPPLQFRGAQAKVPIFGVRLTQEYQLVHGLEKVNSFIHGVVIYTVMVIGAVIHTVMVIGAGHIAGHCRRCGGGGRRSGEGP